MASTLTGANVSPDLSKELINAASGAQLLTSSISDTKEVINNLGKDGSKGISSLIPTLSKAKDAFLGFMNTPWGLGAAVAAGSLVALTYISQSIETFDKAVEKSDASADAYKKAKNSLAAMNDELSKTKTRIQELQSKDTLTIGEEKELDALSSHYTDIEAKANIQEQQTDYKKAIAANDASHTLNFKQRSKADEIAIERGEKRVYQQDKSLAVMVTPTKEIHKDIESIEKYKKKLAELKKEQSKLNPDSDAWKDKQKDIESYQNDITALTDNLSKNTDVILKQKEALTDDSGKPLDKKYQTDVDSINKALHEASTFDMSAEDKKIADTGFFFEANGLDNIKSKLQELASQGKLTDEAISSAFPGLNTALEKAGISVQDLNKYFSELGEGGKASIEKLADPLDQYNAALQTENAGDDYLKIMEGLEKTKSLADQGLTGTDDYQTFAKMISSDGSDDKEGFYKNYKFLKEYDVDSDKGREKLLQKLQDNNLASKDKKSGNWVVDIENTAQAAKDLETGIAPLEAALGRLQDYDIDVSFSSVIEQFNEAQTSLSELREIANGMDDEAEKNTLLGEIEVYDQQITKAKGNLSSLPPEIVTELKFKVSQEQLKKNLDDVNNKIKFSGNAATADNVALRTEALTNYQQMVDNEKERLGLNKKGAHLPEAFASVENQANKITEKLQAPDLSLEDNIRLQNELLDLYERYNNILANSTKEDLDKYQQASQNAETAQTVSYDPTASTDKNSSDGYTSESGGTHSPFTQEPPREFNRAALMPDSLPFGEIEVPIIANSDSFNEEMENVQGTQIDDKVSNLFSNDQASSNVGLFNALSLFSKVSNLLALDSASPKVNNYNGKTLTNKNSKLSALDLASAVLLYILSLFGLVPTSVTMSVSASATGTKKKSKKGPAGANGTAHAKGTAPLITTATFSNGYLGQSYARGDWAAKKTEKALVGELGQETVVRDGRFFTVGDNGAEFANIRRGDIIFNHLQTKELFKKGYVTSGGGRGRSYARGTAYAGGSKKMEKALKALDKLFDWTEIRLNRLSENTKRYTTKVEYYNSLTNQQKTYQSAINSKGKEISAQNSASKKYMREAKYVAKKTGLSSSIQKKVRNGSINISSYGENTQKAIREYQEWYEKAMKCKDAVTELKIEQRKLAKEKLDNIVGHYDDLNKVLSAMADKYRSYRNYRTSMGYSQTSDYEKNAYVNERKQKSGELKNLTSAKSKYVSEFNKQVRSGKIIKGGDDWQDAKRQIADFDAAIYDAKTAINDLNAQIREINFKKLEIAIDNWDRKIKALENSISLKEKTGAPLKEADYMNVIKANNKEYSYQAELKKKYQDRQRYVAVNSKEYQDLADKISNCDSSMTSLKKSNEEYKQSIRELRWKSFNEGVRNINNVNDELKDLQSFINRDNLLDDKGAITSDGFANLALIGQQMGNYKQLIADYTQGLHNLDQELKSGNITQESYNEQQQDFLDKIRSSASSVEDLKNEVLDLAKAQMEAENDALTKSINKRSEALRKKKEYYDYDKTIRNKNKDINALKAQIAALEGVSNKSGQAELARLKADLAEKEEDLGDTKKDHAYNLRIEGYNQLSDDANDALQKTLKALETNSDLQQQTVSNMLDKIKEKYKTAYDEIAKIIEKTGITTSKNTQKNLDDLKTEKGAASQTDKATAPNKGTPASGSTKVDTGKIDTNAKAPGASGGRKVAAVRLSKSSVTLTEGASTTLTASISPSDSGKKVEKWTSSNPNVASVSSKGKVTARKAGTTYITATAGGVTSNKCKVKVNKKPKKKATVTKQKTKSNTSKASGQSKGSQKTKKSSYAGTVSGLKNYYQMGSRGPAVKKIQTALKNLGYKGNKKSVLKVDGIWGSNTDTALRAFQRSMKIKDDGIIGPKTKAKFKAKGYKFGTLGVSEDQIARINELGKELVVRHNGNDYTYLSKGDGVIPADLTKNLMLWGRINPAEHSLPKATVNTIAPDIDLHFDKFIEVKGNLDSSTMPELRKAQKEITQLVTAELTKEFRKLGHK